MHACTHVTYAALCMCDLRAWCAWYTGMCGVCGWHACWACVRGVNTIRAWLACARAYVWSVREWRAGMRVCSIIYLNFNPASTFKSACTANSRSHSLTRGRASALSHIRSRTRSRTHKQNTRAHTHACTHLHSHAHAREKLVFQNVLYLVRGKEMANTWSAISWLQIDEIKKIQRGFQEYDFDFKISNSVTWITCFLCSTFLLLTALPLQFLRDHQLEKKYCGSAY